MPPMHYSLFGVLAAAIFAASAIVSRHRFIEFGGKSHCCIRISLPLLSPVTAIAAVTAVLAIARRCSCRAAIIVAAAAYMVVDLDGSWQ